MPTVDLNYLVVKKALGKISDEQLKERIAMLGTDLDTLSKEGIIVEVFPNRPDMLAEYGFIRALRSFLGLEKGARVYKTKPSGEKVFVKKSVRKVRPYTVCAIVSGLKLDEEKILQIIQLQEKLHGTHCRNRKKGAIGVYPSEKIKYPIEYFAAPPKDVKFIPLGETKEMDGLQILSRHPTGREYGHLLEGKKVFPFFRDAKGQILSMPPVINSEFTGKVDCNTREVFIECSGFDLSFLRQLLNILVCELVDMGGHVSTMDVVYPDGKVVTPDLSLRKMKLDEKYVTGLLGEKVDIKKNLGKMGITYRVK